MVAKKLGLVIERRYRVLSKDRGASLGISGADGVRRYEHSYEDAMVLLDEYERA
jgi:hypothetical protein